MPELEVGTMIFITSGSTTDLAFYLLTGAVRYGDPAGPSALSYRVDNGATVALPPALTFAARVPLAAGAHTIDVYATDARGGDLHASVEVVSTPRAGWLTTKGTLSAALPSVLRREAT